MSTEYPNTRAHARLKATRTQKQTDVHKITDPDPSALSED